MENENTFEKNFTENFIEIVENIIFLLNNKKYVAARDALLRNNEVDIAEILEEVLEALGIEKTVIIFRTLPKDVSVEVFPYLPVEDQVAIINVITDKEIRYILDELDFDDMIDVLEELPANLVDKILEKTPKEERKLINTFLNYPDTCAGSLMTPYYISLNKDMIVEQALAHIKNEGMDSETIYTCYVKEQGRKLLGIISLRTLVISENNAKIKDLMHEDFVCVNVHDDQEVVSEAFKKYGFLAIPVVDNEDRLVGIITVKDLMHEDFVCVNVHDDQEVVSEAFKKYGFLAIPVVDNEDRLVGIITVDDILDVIEEETTEDFQRMAGVIDSGDAEYLDISVWKHVK